MTSFRIRNWSKFQHYGKRNPPWIKLHFELLASEDWVALDDASRVLAVACMLIASRNNGEVPNNPAHIKRVAYLNRPPNFNPLIECGFLEKPLANNDTMLADASALQTDARPETETETEKEKKGTTNVVPKEKIELGFEPSKPKATPEPRGSRLPDDFLPDGRAHALADELLLSSSDCHRALENFFDYWQAVPGAKGRKLDWQKTFRNWLREFDTRRNRNGKTTSPQNTVADGLDKAGAVIAEIRRRQAGRGEEGGNDDSETLPGLWTSAG